MDFRALFLGLAFALMWSSAFATARIIVADAPPLFTLTIRFFISGLVGIFIARWMGESMRLTSHQWRAVIIFGLCQNALYLGLNFVGMQTVEASFASIIASTMPLMVAFFGWIAFREKLPVMALTGIVLGFIGVIVIMSGRLSGGSDGYGIALCFIGAIALTVATLSVRSASSGGNLLMVVGLQMLVGSAILLVAALMLEKPEFTPSWRLGLAFSYQVFVPGLLATSIWFYLVRRIGAVKAATFHFLNPFFGVLIASLLLGEKLSGLDIIGVVIVTLGILAVQLSKQQVTSS